MSPRKGTASINVHLGNALVNIAYTYPTLLDAILEMVQNSIDAGSMRIDIKVDYSGHIKSQGKSAAEVSVLDDGDGTTIADFNEALNNVCQTQKSDDKMGRFGIGLISPLGKCAKFTFTSCGRAPEGQPLYKYVVWSFVTEDIKARHTRIDAPYTFREDLLHTGDQIRISSRNPRFGGRAPNVVWWRSKMDLFELSPDSEIGIVRIDALRKEILNRFGVVMARKRVRVRIEITDRDGKNTADDFVSQGYSGTALPVYTVNNKYAGKVTFRLFVAPRAKSGRRSGMVNVGEAGNDFRFPIRFLFAKPEAKVIDREAIDALLEGTLEGEITAEKVELHPSRQAFKTNDASDGLLEAIEEWFRTVGSSVVVEARETRKDERLQQIGREVMTRFKHLLPKLPDLQSVFDLFHLGNTGIGHTEVPGKIGGQVVPSISVDGDRKPPKNGQPGKSDEDDREPRDRSDPPEDEKKKHRPMTVQGPKGKHRTIVKDSSVGLQLAYDGMEDSMNLWDIELEHGILRFNQRHPLWVLCEKNDKNLISLQILVIIQALTLALQPTAVRDQQRKILDAVTENYVKGWFLSEASVAVPTRRKAKKDGEKK